jgi:hypothetical protein
LFIKETSLGEFKTGIGKVKYIPPSDYKETYSNLNIKVKINAAVDEVDLEINDSSFGHYAVFIQPYLSLLAESDLKDLIENSLKNQMETIEITEWKIKNSEPEALGKLPFVINTTAKNNNLIEKAGDKYLFKVGELIGPQMELYSRDERKLPLYSDYKRQYMRHIEIVLPTGYSVKNLSDLKLFSVSEKDGKKILVFDSHYKLEGNSVIIDIVEFYDQLYFDKDEYQKYREVVNRASDFNKVVLILEKK